MMGQRTRAFTAIHSEDPAMFDADRLNQFDAIIMLNTTGDCLANHKGPLDEPEQAQLDARTKNLHDFVYGGKGLVGVHSATDTLYSFKEYGDMIGGWFTGHPWHQEVPLKIDAPNHPLTQMFDAEKDFVIKDEIYQFAPRGRGATFGGYQPYSREKLRVLLSLDASKMDVSRGKRTDGDYAISWIHEYGDGRVFYSSLGHNDFIYYHPVILKHFLAGIQYALGDLPADATPSAADSANAKQTTKVVRPFNGENLDGWKLKHPQPNHWVAGEAKLDPKDPTKLVLTGGKGQLVNVQGRGVDIFTEDKYGDCHLELEVMVPKGSNSGIYLHGNYEVQVFDSYGKPKAGPADIGGIYGAAAPRVNAAKPPGTWQKFVIDFQAPRFKEGKKVANARFRKVILNGQILHEDVEVAGPTGGNLGQGEGATGPLLFQGDHGPVAYRNIEVTLLP